MTRLVHYRWVNLLHDSYTILNDTQDMDSRLKIFSQPNTVSFKRDLRQMFRSMKRKKIKLHISQLPGFTLRYMDHVRANVD